MKKILVLLALLPVIGFSQEGKPIKSIAIPRDDSPKPDDKPETSTSAPQYSIAKPFEPKMFKVPNKVYEMPKLEKQNSINQPKSDLNVGKQFADKMNKSFSSKEEGGPDPKIFRRHQDFGQFKTESATLAITYRDFGEIDGDNVRVWIDGKIVADLIQLGEERKTIYIGLIMGINYIEIEALNEGYYFPNTGEFSFFDDEGKLITSDKWDLSTGFKAKFSINRVPKGSILVNKK
ncbi:MAG: hypothetical protein V4670_00555 [Bacteroidota bacterium]